MLKNIGFYFLFFTCLGTVIFLNSKSIEKSIVQEIKGSQLYWNERIGSFTSADDYRKTVDALRSEILKTPSRRSLGINWRELGPDNIGGRTRAFLVDNKNPNLLFAGGVSGGLWFSNNGGQSWNQTSPGDQAEYLTITSITQDNQGYIYYGTGEGLFYEALGNGVSGFIGKGVFRSIKPHGTDFKHLSSSWSLLNKSNFVSVNAMASDDKGNVYAACMNMLYRSNNQGASWDVVSSIGSLPVFGAGWDVAVTPDGFVVVALGAKIFTSPTGNSGSFSAVSNSELPLFTGRVTLAIAPSNDDVIYISSATSKGVLDAIYQSKDKGITWDKIIGGGSSLFSPFTGGGPQGNYDQCIAVYPNNPNRILLGGIELYRWEEGGNWEKLSKWNAQWNDHDYVHADKHTIRFDTFNPELFYLGTDGGIFKTKDDGVIFERLNRGYAVTQLYGVAFGSDGVLLGGTQDNSNVYIDGKGNTKNSADLHNSGDGGWSAISQLSPDAFFVESQYGRIRRNNSRSSTYDEFFYHPDAALNSSNADYDSYWNEFVTPFILWESKNDDLIPDSVNFTADKTYLIGEVLNVNSGVANVKFDFTLKSTLNLDELVKIKNPIQSMLAYSSYQAIWITREPLDFSKVPNWIKVADNGLSTSNRIGATAMAISKDGDDLFYGTRLGEIYRISNLSNVVDDASAISESSVTKIANLKTKSGYSAYITSISIDPNNPENIIVTVGHYNENVNVYVSNSAKSTNDLVSFYSVQGDLPNFPVYGSLIEYHTGAYVVGTEYGVYTSTNDGLSWSREVDIPYCPTLMISQQTWQGSQNFGQIYVATHGRGFFTSEHYVGSDEVIKNVIILEKLKIFPNPVFNNFKINISSRINGVFNASIYNTQGKLVKIQKSVFTNGISDFINISNLPKGRYFVQLNYGKVNYKGDLLKR